MARRRNSEPSNQALAASAIRRELKAAFPTVAFRVTSKGYSMGDHVDVRWTDGPTTNQVDSLIGKYQYGSFDGMIDLYEYTNVRDDIPQTKYVMTSRDISPAAFAAVVALLNRTRYGFALVVDHGPYAEGRRVTHESDQWTGNGWQSQEIHHTLVNLPLLCSSCQGATLPGDTFCPMCGTRLDGQNAEAA
jgi:hypothetical protein